MTVSGSEAPPEEDLVLLDEESARRVAEAVRRNVEEKLQTEEVKLEIERRIAEGLKKMFDDVDVQLEKEKQEALAEGRRKLREELQREESQRREVLELQRKEEEQQRELERIQRQKEESAQRKKLEEE